MLPDLKALKAIEEFKGYRVLRELPVLKGIRVHVVLPDLKVLKGIEEFKAYKVLLELPVLRGIVVLRDPPVLQVWMVHLVPVELTGRLLMIYGKVWVTTVANKIL